MTFIAYPTGNQTRPVYEQGGLLTPWLSDSLVPDKTVSEIRGMRVDNSGSQFMRIASSSNEVTIDSSGAMKVTGSGGVTGLVTVSIWSGSNQAAVETNNALRVRDRFVSTFDMFKYQVGVDLGSYAAATGTNLITLSADFNGYIREQFPKYIYEVTEDSLYTVNGFTGSTIFAGLTQSRLDLSTSITATSPKFVIKYNGPQNAYDVSTDTIKGLNQNPIWSRYSDVETLTPMTFSTVQWNDLGPEIDMRGYNTLVAYLTILPQSHSGYNIKPLYKHTYGGADEYDAATYLYPNYSNSVWAPSGSDIIITSQSYTWKVADTGSNKLRVLEIPVSNGIPYIQLQIYANAFQLSPIAAGISGSVTASIIKAWR